MAKGIYCYIDKKDNQIVYVGKDSNIDKNKRRRHHLTSSKYNQQPINRILQNNPDRYTYQVLVWSVEDENALNALEIQYIRQLQPRFNFTEGGDGISGYRHTEKSKRKMSKAQKGENNPMYGKIHSEETRKKMSKAQNTTGFYRVSKKKDNKCKQGFVWLYKYFDNNKRKAVSSTDLKKLEKKVKAQSLPWQIVNENKARQSLKKDIGDI